MSARSSTSTTSQHLSADFLSKGKKIAIDDVYYYLRQAITEDFLNKVIGRLQLVIFTQVAHKEPMFVNAKDHIPPGEIRRVWSIERRTLEGYATPTISPARKLSTQNVVEICRRVDVENFIISRNHSIGIVETFDVAVNFTICFFDIFNAILEKPDRKLALDRAPHSLDAALCLWRPRQDLMDVELFTNTLPLSSFFMHNLELFPGC